MLWLCVCKPEAQMVAWGTSGIPPGMGGLLPTGLSWEAAGFQHMGTVVAAAASQLRPAPGEIFSSLVRDAGGLKLGFYGLMLDKGGGELLTELRSRSLDASQLCTAAFLWERSMEEPPSPLWLPNTAQRRH